MFRIRPFRNDDPPALAKLWRSQNPLRGRLQAVTAELLEEHVFCKPLFDRQGFFVAADGDQLIGFCHAAFGPTPDGSTLNSSIGIICLLMLAPGDLREAAAPALLQQAEQYLKQRGAAEIYGGGASPLHPFYLGLYGGAQLPGILQSDRDQLVWFQQAGYQEVERRLILQRPLAGFRPAVDRQQMQLRRSLQVDTNTDPAAPDWWSACTLAGTNCTTYRVAARGGGSTQATAWFWDVQPLASGWGQTARGLAALEIADRLQFPTLGPFLLGEAMRQMQSDGVSLVEVQAANRDEPSLALFRQLGFQEVDQGLVLKRPDQD